MGTVNRSKSKEKAIIVEKVEEPAVTPPTLEEKKIVSDPSVPVLKFGYCFQLPIEKSLEETPDGEWEIVNKPDQTKSLVFIQTKTIEGILVAIYKGDKFFYGQFYDGFLGKLLALHHERQKDLQRSVKESWQKEPDSQPVAQPEEK